MEIHRKSRETGIFNPSELALLGRVFEQLKVEGDLVGQNEALASRIIANFMAGVIDEAELASLSKRPLGR
jgi:hypothetical protein